MKYTQSSLSKKDRSHLKQAKKIASTSTVKHKHGAVIVSGGRVLSVGVNSAKNEGYVFPFAATWDRQIHAEEAALRGVKGKAEGATIYVARVNRMGMERMSKPCHSCQKALKDAGIRRVVYTIDSELTLD